MGLIGLGVFDTVRLFRDGRSRFTWTSQAWAAAGLTGFGAVEFWAAGDVFTLEQRIPIAVFFWGLSLTGVVNAIYLRRRSRP